MGRKRQSQYPVGYRIGKITIPVEAKAFILALLLAALAQWMSKNNAIHQRPQFPEESTSDTNTATTNYKKDDLYNSVLVDQEYISEKLENLAWFDEISQLPSAEEVAMNNNRILVDAIDTKDGKRLECWEEYDDNGECLSYAIYYGGKLKTFSKQLADGKELIIAYSIESQEPLSWYIRHGNEELATFLDEKGSINQRALLTYSDGNHVKTQLNISETGNVEDGYEYDETGNLLFHLREGKLFIPEKSNTGTTIYVQVNLPPKRK